MARVTRTQLDSMAQRINRRLGRPLAHSIRHDDGTYESCEGHIFVERHAPGDRTYFRLMVVSGPHGGVADFGTSRGMSAYEMDCYLSGILDGIDALRERGEIAR